MKKLLTQEEILASFGEGFDCSQVVLRSFAEELGLDEEMALKISSAFGGGMWQGRTCGAVAGALMVIGLKYGHCKAGDADAKNKMLAVKAEFEKRFSALYSSCVCKDILGYDLSTPDGMAKIQEQNLLATKCPKLVSDAIAILEEVL